MVRIVHDRTQSILECVGKPSITPSEFVGLLEEDVSGSRQKIEDEAFKRLCRGYLVNCSDWVRFFNASSFIPYLFQCTRHEL
jgi:hypothetical protein